MGYRLDSLPSRQRPDLIEIRPRAAPLEDGGEEVAAVDPAIRAYIAGAAADGITQRDNRSAFDRVKLMPRALIDMSQATARTALGAPIRTAISA